MKEQFFEFLESLHGDEALMEAVRKGFETIVEMGGTNRVYQAMTAQEPSYAILTAFRKEYPFKENVVRNEELKRDLRSMGYSWKRVSGGWIENKTTKVKENSFMVTKPSEKSDADFVSDMTSLVAKYEQDAFTYKAPNTDKIIFIGPDGKQMTDWGSVTNVKPELVSPSSQGFTGKYTDPKKDNPNLFTFRS